MSAPHPKRQVPLDRVTQHIYASIVAAMAPLREKLAHASAVAGLLSDAFSRFHESLPDLDLPAYVTLRADVGSLASLLGEAPNVPLSPATRGLTSQLLDHDLPRVAAIAAKLNEDEAPKFFAAINYSKNPIEDIASLSPQKTTLRKHDLVAAIDDIVRARLRDAERMIREDLASYFANNGLPANAAQAGDRYALRKDSGIWHLTFDWQHANLRHERGLLFVCHLLKNPPAEPIHALDLLTRIPEIYRSQTGIAGLSPESGSPPQSLDRSSRLVETNFSADNAASMRKLQSEIKRLENDLDSEKLSEPEKAETIQRLEELYTWQNKAVMKSRTNADRVVRTVRKAIARLHDTLASATTDDGRPHPVITAFAAHVQKHIIDPSSRRYVRRPVKGIRSYAGCFTYESPTGVVWK